MGEGPEMYYGKSRGGVRFAYDCDDRVVVYTDGACTRNGQPGAKAGIGVWFDEDHPFNVSDPVTRGRATNNGAEIQAVTRALDILKREDETRVSVLTDSSFVVASVNCYIPKWIRKNWRRANGEPVKNQREFLDLIEVKQGMDVQIRHISGHNGIRGNIESDRLAREGAQYYESESE